jgi:hypothetical protein
MESKEIYLNISNVTDQPSVTPMDTIQGTVSCLGYLSQALNWARGQPIIGQQISGRHVQVP